MLELIDQWDQELFIFLNGMNVSWLDPVMSYATKMWTWLPLYLILIYLIIRVEGKKWIYILILIAFCILLTDQFSASLLKPIIGRLRPCHNESLQEIIHLVGRCGGKYGFVSSHAANTFGVATFLFLLLRKNLNYMGFLFAWAGLVAYTRIYLGVHYPLDIVFGALSGAVIGFLVYRIYLIYKFRVQTR